MSTKKDCKCDKPALVWTFAGNHCDRCGGKIVPKYPGDVKSEKPKYNQICKMTTSGKHMYEERVVTFNGMYYKKCILCEVIDDAEERGQTNY